MAFEYASFVARNPAYVTKNIRKQRAVRRAMLAHRKKHPRCELTGRTKNLQVHHLIPVSVAPHLAADPDNLMTLEARAHLWFAHAGNYQSYILNAKALLSNAEIIKTLAHGVRLPT